MLSSEVPAGAIEQEDLVVGTLPKMLYDAIELRLATFFVSLYEILGLDCKSTGNQVLPRRQRYVGSQEQATDNRRRYHRPK